MSIEQINNERPLPHLNSIPKDLVNLIVNYLSRQEMYPLRFVNKKLYQILTHSLTPNYFAYEPGIKIGSLAYCKWIKSLKFPLSISGFNESAERGHLELLKWFHENGCSFNEGTGRIAAE